MIITSIICITIVALYWITCYYENKNYEFKEKEIREEIDYSKMEPPDPTPDDTKGFLIKLREKYEAITGTKW